MESCLRKSSVCVLISCMNQGKDIVDRTHVQTNVVVVNQCGVDSIEEWEFTNAKGCICHAKYISTRERGLSRSRNMAIRNAMGDICLISDDDEELVDDYESIITDAYQSQPDAQLITFAFNRKGKSFSKNATKHNIRSLLKTSSVEITFLRDAVLDKCILFDEKMGSGSNNGAGEENMFLMTCRRSGLKMFYNPAIIGKLLSVDSQWFKGYTPKYFEDLGWSNKRILGSMLSVAYLGYWLVSHRNLYIKDISFIKAAKSCLIGWVSKR